MNLSAVINLQLVMFALFICGFILTRKGVINSERRKGMSDLLIDLFLPANIICSLSDGHQQGRICRGLSGACDRSWDQIISYLLGLVLYRKEVNGREWSCAMQLSVPMPDLLGTGSGKGSMVPRAYCMLLFI